MCDTFFHPHSREKYQKSRHIEGIKSAVQPDSSHELRTGAGLQVLEDLAVNGKSNLKKKSMAMASAFIATFASSMNLGCSSRTTIDQQGSGYRPRKSRLAARAFP